MHYIVLDLEWNQPESFQSSIYRKVGQDLLFEVIQIGASRLNENFEIEASFSRLVCPTCYRVIHHRVKRMTGITQEMLCDAPEFKEAMDDFLDFCGDDAVFVTWGGEDISVLQQNMEFFKVGRTLPKTYNLQPLYSRVMKTGGQTGLSNALQALEIEAEEDKPFHNAEWDAYYTSKVFQKMPVPGDVLAFPVEPKKFNRAASKIVRITDTIQSVRETLDSDKLCHPLCPTCNQPMRLTTQIIPQAPGRYIALCRCKQHGQMVMKARFVPLKNDQKGMSFSIVPANQNMRAYVHTKELQYQYREKRGDFEGQDVEDLTDAYLSNMPFDNL